MKYRNFTKFLDVETLWKHPISADFWANCPKLCENCACPQNVNNGKLGEISVLYAVRKVIKSNGHKGKYPED